MAHIRSIYLFSVFLIIFTGCSVSKHCEERKALLLQAKADTGCFAVYKDGSIKNFRKLLLKTSVVSVPYLLADDSLKIFKDEIYAYQTEEYYAINQIRYNRSSHSKIATECLPGFAIRIASGKLNVYERICYHSNTCKRDYFIQVGTHGAVYDYTPELMNTVLRHHYDAYNYFNRKGKMSLKERIYTSVELYNNAPSFTKK
jgi:hypothetical protein